MVRERWLGRPGDVVKVGLRDKETPAGFYVPEDAIQFDGTKYHVAVAEGAADGTQQVALVPIVYAIFVDFGMKLGVDEQTTE